MSDSARNFVSGVIAGIVGLIALAGAGALAYVYSGTLNVAATEEHASLTRWAFDTTFHNSVERRANRVAAPQRMTPQMVEDGAREYKAMCQHCHAGAGAERAGWAKGMRPLPPHLKEAAADWTIQEVFWIVKHGVRMTGMPAFGPTHDDETLWSLAAFVKELPAMTPDRYAELGGDGKHGDSEGKTHGRH